MKHKIKVFIIDDHLIVRDGLKALFKEETDLIIVGESDGQIDIAAFSKAVPDIVLMDISLNRKSGIELTKELLKIFSKTKVIILSMLSSEESVISAVDAGASGYLPKSTSKDEMIKAICEVYEGRSYFHPEIASVIVNSMRSRRKYEDENTPCINCLSKREVQIIELYAQGFTNQEIADKLFISIRTVESHKTHIMQKLGFKSTVEMVKFALKNKLIELN